MATTSKSEKIFIGIDNETIELKGIQKDAFIAEREKDKVEFELFEADNKAKKEARENALKKLAEIAGLSKEELASIL